MFPWHEKLVLDFSNAIGLSLMFMLKIGLKKARSTKTFQVCMLSFHWASSDFAFTSLFSVC